MFFKDFTPLTGSANQIRAGRIYPGGKHLDVLVGPKTDHEAGWFYPEAWIFSPEPALNLGSKRVTEGQTIVYDSEGNPYRWKDYLRENGKAVLGDHSLRIKVKLLDGECTLPKEFHFMAKDEVALRKFPMLKNFRGTLIKPEVWIRHPNEDYHVTPSYIGFNRLMDPDTLYGLVTDGVSAMEKAMNRVTLLPGEGLYLAGGLVHSLGKGLYFEVLADGDFKVTLQDHFAGRNLSLKDQVDKLYTNSHDDLRGSLDFVDYSEYGECVLEKARCPWDHVQPRTTLVKTPWFRVDWIRVDESQSMTINVDKPHILAMASGRAELESPCSHVTLQTHATTFKHYFETRACYAVVIHDELKSYTLRNNGKEPALMLAAYGN